MFILCLHAIAWNSIQWKNAAMLLFKRATSARDTRMALAVGRQQTTARMPALPALAE